MAGGEADVLLRDAEPMDHLAFIAIPLLIETGTAQIDDGANAELLNDSFEAWPGHLRRPVNLSGDDDVQIVADKAVDEEQDDAEKQPETDAAQDHTQERGSLSGSVRDAARHGVLLRPWSGGTITAFGA